MAGTGTETDPFIVGSWSEFVAVNTDNYLKFIKFADSDNKTIDFNDISSVGMSKITIRNCVDFNNWTLINFYSEDTSIFCIDVTSFTGIDWIIKNLNFLNFYHITNKGSFIHIKYGGSKLKDLIYNCKFSGCINYAASSQFIYSNSGGVNFRILGCSFNIEGKCGTDFNFILGTSNSNPLTANNFVKCQSVQFKLNLNLASGSICKATVLKECLIDGKINITSEQTEVAMIVGDATSDKVDIGGNNVCLLNANKPIWYYQKGDNILVYDNTQSTFTENSVNAIGCAPAQLTDAAYLKSIGFDIGVD